MRSAWGYFTWLKSACSQLQTTAKPNRGFGSFHKTLQGKQDNSKLLFCIYHLLAVVIGIHPGQVEARGPQESWPKHPTVPLLVNKYKWEEKDLLPMPPPLQAWNAAFRTPSHTTKSLCEKIQHLQKQLQSLGHSSLGASSRIQKSSLKIKESIISREMLEHMI